MPSQEVSLATLGDGALIERASDRLRDLARYMNRYIGTHKERAKGAKATLTLQVDLKVDDATRGFVYVIHGIKESRPAAPKSHELVCCATEQDGTRTLLHVSNPNVEDDEPGQARIEDYTEEQA